MTAPRLFVCSDEKPRCPYGHRLKVAHRPSADGTLTCDHKDPLSGRACNTVCFVAVVSSGGSPRVRGSGERMWIVVEITPATAREFSRTPMLVLERLHQLGHATPGVDQDLFGIEPPEAA